jgi:hypothetical protein
MAQESPSWVARGGQEHGVLGAHRLVGLAPGLLLLIAQPRGLHILLDFFERGNAAGNDRIDEDQVPAVTGLDRPLPRAGFELRDCQGEWRPELLAQLFGRAVAVIVLEHERIGEGSRQLGILGLTGNPGQRLCGVIARPFATAVG